MEESWPFRFLHLFCIISHSPANLGGGVCYQMAGDRSHGRDSTPLRWLSDVNPITWDCLSAWQWPSGVSACVDLGGILCWDTWLTESLLNPLSFPLLKRKQQQPLAKAQRSCMSSGDDKTHCNFKYATKEMLQGWSWYSTVLHLDQGLPTG